MEAADDPAAAAAGAGEGAVVVEESELERQLRAELTALQVRACMRERLASAVEVLVQFGSLNTTQFNPNLSQKGAHSRLCRPAHPTISQPPPTHRACSTR